MKKRLALALVVLVLAAAALPAVTAAQAPGAGYTVPVTGTAKGGGKVSGTFTIQRFVDNGGEVGALGTLTLKSAATGATGVTQVIMPVKADHRPATAAATSGAAIAAVACEVLDLVLGPLDLNLLGLEIHLDTVHLVIEANPAGGLVGALLGGLLCGVDLGAIFGNLATLIDFLNDVLDILSGIF